MAQTARDEDEEDRGPVHKILSIPGALARWFWAREALRRSTSEATEHAQRFRNVCIGREAGAGGGTIGRLVASKLGWKVYDQEIIDSIAKAMGITADEVKILDELSPSIAQDWILPLREEYYAPQEAYLDHLAKLIDSAGKAGNAVIIGRGANFHLPREETLSVRITAPLKFRAEHLAEVLHVTPHPAGGPRSISIGAARSSSRSCTGRTLGTSTTTIWCSIPGAWVRCSPPSS